MRRTLLTIAAVLSLIAAHPINSTAEAAPADGDYIVVLRGNVDSSSKTTALERANGFAAAHRYRAAIRGFAAHLNAQQLQRISADPDVAFVTPDRPVRLIDAVPMIAGDEAPTGVRRTGAATETTVRQASVVNVAVIDTGIALQHTDLNAVSGTNCIKPGQAAQDDHGHGTHVAGTIGAKNNGAGVVGIVPGTKLYAVKVINSQGTGTTAQVICGIDWVTANAAALNIKVVNMSLGDDGADDGRCGDVDHDAMHRAICNSVAAGITYVAGAGNDSRNLATFVPAAYREVLAVTAIADYDGLPGGAGTATCFDGFFDSDDSPAFFSNFAVEGGGQAHTIAGPGVCITSTWLNNGYSTISGTSMATPHLTGSVALCFGDGSTAGPCAGLTPAQVVTKMIATAAEYANANPDNGFDGDPLHPSGGAYYGYLVWAGQPPVPDTTAPIVSAVQVAVTQSSATITWTTDEPADGQVEYGATSAYGSSSPLDPALVMAHSVRLDGLTAESTYHYRIKSKDKAGNLTTTGDLTFTTAPVSADLVLSGTASPNPVQIGSPLTYTLTALNKGPSAASGVRLTDTLPAGVTFVSATASQGSCAQSGGQVSCDLGALNAGYPAQVLADLPVGYWRLDETSGTVAQDSSGNGRSGTVDPGVSLGAPALAGGSGAAMSFSGSTQIVRVAGFGAAVQNSAAGQTLEFWADPDPADTEWIAVGLAPSGADEIQRYSDGQGYWASFRSSRIPATPTRTSGPHHFVVTRQPGVGWKLYIDGAVAYSTTDAGTFGISADLRIGFGDSQFTTRAFKGRIDEVAVYNSALSAARVLAHYQAAAQAGAATVTIVVTAGAAGQLTNTATVSANEADPVSANNTITQVSSAQPPSADLALSGTVAPDPVQIGSPLTYTLNALNRGPSAASGVALTDTLPGSVSFVSVGASQGSCAHAAGRVTCDLGALAAGYAAQVLQDSPIGYWRLDETSGTVAADSSGNGRNGTIDPGVTLGAPPLAGGGGAAMSFSGSGAIVRVAGAGSALQESAAGQTLEFWADPDPADAEWIAVGIAPSGADEIQRYSNGQGYWAALRTARLAGTPTRTSGAHHFVVTRQPGVGWKLYIDGALAYSADAGTFGAAADLRIGFGETPFTARAFKGRVDEVALYNRALSSARIQAHYAAAAQSGQAVVTIVVNPTSAGQPTNSATVSANETDSVTANNTLTQTSTVVSPSADLALAGTASPNPVAVGSPLNYTLTALNRGPDPATGVALSDTLPANTTFVSASASQGTCTQSAGTVSCAIGSLAVGYSAQVLADSPLGYWRLDETSGTVAADSSGNGRNGTIDAGVTLGAPALAGGSGAAMSFTGTGPIVRVSGLGAAVLNGPAGQTLEFWAEPDPADAEWIAVGLAPASADELQRYSDGQGYWATFRTARLPGTPTRTSGAHHFVVSRQPGVGWKLYIDGTLVRSADAGTFAISADLRIGFGESQFPTRAFKGRIDEVAVYNSALSAARVLAHYLAAPQSGSASVTIVVTPNAAGQLTNSASLDGNETDPVGANDTLTQVTTAQ